MRKLLNIILTLILLVVFTLPMVLPNKVYALTEARTVSGDGTISECGYYWAAIGGTFANLNSDDGDTSGWAGSTAGTGYKAKSWQITDTAIAGVVTNVSLTVKSRSDIAGQNLQLFTYDGINRYTFTTVFNSTISYVEYTANWATNPATGRSWTIAEINSNQFGASVSTGFANVLITYMYLTITYTPFVAPTVSTIAASGILYDGAHKATLNGSIDATGGENPNWRGFQWGTTSNTTMPASTQSPRTTPYSANYTEGGSFGVASFNYQIVAGLAAGTTYYYRAYAHNSVGWTYGTQLSFTTLTNPDVTTQAATYVSATSVRLNSLVVNNGGQLADIRFGYSTVSGSCTDGADCTGATCTFNATSYNGTTPWVVNTYATGSQPYVDISGLVPSTTYYFCVQIRNDVSCRCGGQLTFTTSSGVNEPTVFKGIPAATTMSLFWIKGIGATRTMIRYKLNSYPTGIADGSQAYFDSQTSVVVTGVTMGTTYYLVAWGESGGTYSTSNATLIITTLSGDSTAGVPPAPLTTGTSWFQSPDYSNMSSVPWYGMVNWWADTFGIPRGTLWFFCAIFLALIGGILVYWKGGQKIMLTGIVVILLIGFGVTLKLVSMWLLLPFLIVFFTSVVIGERM